MGQLADVNEMINQDLGVADAMNSTIQPVNHFEENEQIVNDIYIRMLEEAREEFTATEYDLLYTIATENPISGGSAVYSARVMLGLDFDDSVDNVGGRMAGPSRKPVSLQNKKTTVKSETLTTSLIPNPANEKATYKTTLEKGYNGIFELKNTFGKTMASYNLTEGLNNIEIPLINVESGIYFYSASVNGLQTDNGKLIITH